MSSQKKRVNTNAYFDTVVSLLQEGKTMVVPISGSSMAPFLVDGRDCVEIGPRMEGQPLCAGEIVLYQRKSGQYVVHRLGKKKKDGTWNLLGDGETKWETGIAENQILGIALSAQRKGIWIGTEHVWWKFFRFVWRWLRPFRVPICKGYAMVFRTEKRR